jgi:hypothetical protein
MLEEQGAAMEAALWMAVRVLMERAGLLRRLAERVRVTPGSIAQRRFEEAAEDAERQAAIIRDGIVSRGTADLAREGSA